ncbi:MAG: efflux transporter outer membrane subunit [Rhodoferax sp.]|jgi:NodT family efflux transporter outer membrane factor (OMF) lipoprotein|nr:efflux transporter outer membrane subunit [Rhodoferax sp.]
MRTASIPLLLSLLLSACAAPRPQPPAPELAPTAYKETGVWKHADGAAAVAPVPDDWWTLFHDPVLDDLQQRLVVGNQNLRLVLAQMANARALRDASRSATLPTVSVGAGATRNATASGTTASSAQNPSNSLSLSASAAWELDLWGRLETATQAAQASYQASADDLASARLSASATLTQTYLAMRAAEAQRALLERSTIAYERSLALTQARYDAGVAARSDVLQAQIQLANAQVQQREASVQRAQLEHAIAVLLGLAPSALTLAPTGALPALPEVPQMLPSTLLERRPDIAAAQRRVAAAYAQIGVADAAFFPSIGLSATAGLRDAALAHLISAPNLFWSLGASVAQSVFDGGQRKLASAQARASADQVTASYRQVVLTALQEVEDNLVLLEQLRLESQLQQQALQAAQRNLDITQAQYRAGTVSYLSVVTAQNAALGAESTSLSVHNRQLAAVNLLLKNVAGRWQPVADAAR